MNESSRRLRASAPIPLNPFARFLFGWSAILLSITTGTLRADLAMTNGAFEGSGFVNGAAAFTFTPVTDLAVTSVGYNNLSLSNPVIRFWSNTNFIVATFPLAMSASNSVMVYSNVQLTLLAGRRYSISVQEGSNFPSGTMLLNFHNTNQFQPASLLSNYVGATIISNGVFSGQTFNYYYRGPNFTFQAQTAALEGPQLNIFRGTGDSAVLEWAASPAGWVLQQRTNLANTNWGLLTNVPTVVSASNRVTVTPLTTNRFYRLFHP